LQTRSTLDRQRWGGCLQVGSDRRTSGRLNARVLMYRDRRGSLPKGTATGLGWGAAGGAAAGAGLRPALLTSLANRDMPPSFSLSPFSLVLDMLIYLRLSPSPSCFHRVSYADQVGKNRQASVQQTTQICAGGHWPRPPPTAHMSPRAHPWPFLRWSPT
jgi:hypothetical protein